MNVFKKKKCYDQFEVSYYFDSNFVGFPMIKNLP